MSLMVEKEKWISYNVKIKEGVPYSSDRIIHDNEVLNGDSTASILFTYENGRVEELEYRYVTKEYVYELIRNGKDINLNRTYVKDFNYQIAVADLPYTKRKLKNFAAEFAFFDGRVSFAQAEFDDGDISFSFSRFGNGMVNFGDAKFGEGKVDFISTHYSADEIYFTGTNFGCGKTSFFGSKFGKAFVSFRGAVCDGDFDISYSVFEMGEKNFSFLNFSNCNLSFDYTKFLEGNVYFDNILKVNTISFFQTIFINGVIDFNFTKSVETLKFERTRFSNNEMIFREAKIGVISYIDCNLDLNISMPVSTVNTMSFNSCFIEKNINLSSSDVKKMEFRNTVLSGQIALGWEKNNVKQMIYSQPNSPNTKFKPAASTSFYEKMEQFRLLKENFNKLGQYDDEDAAYVEYMRCKCKDLKEHNNHFRAAIYKILDEIGGYATRPGKVFITMLYTLYFSALYYILPFVNISDKFGTCPLQQFGASLYFSAVTFLTIGFGDIEPLNIWACIGVGIEGFLGMFLMSYFTVAVVRKTLR